MAFDYNSRKWRKKRAYILKRDGYFCRYYKRYGKNVEAHYVHHVLPASEFPEFAWENWNLIALSTEAHRKAHNLDGSLTEMGMELVRIFAKRPAPIGDDEVDPRTSKA